MGWTASWATDSFFAIETSGGHMVAVAKIALNILLLVAQAPSHDSTGAAARSASLDSAGIQEAIALGRQTKKAYCYGGRQERAQLSAIHRRQRSPGHERSSPYRNGLSRHLGPGQKQRDLCESRTNRSASRDTIRRYGHRTAGAHGHGRFRLRESLWREDYAQRFDRDIRSPRGSAAALRHRGGELGERGAAAREAQGPPEVAVMLQLT